MARVPIPQEDWDKYFDENGRLKKGHPGLPRAGRPTKRKETEYLYALQDGMPPDDLLELWRAAIQAAKAHAERYNTPKQLFKAIEMMMNWGYGRPKVSVDMTNADAIEVMKQLIADDPEREDFPREELDSEFNNLG